MIDVSRYVGIFRTRMVWTNTDTDAYGICRNSTVSRFIEAAEARLMAARPRRLFPVVAAGSLRGGLRGASIFRPGRDRQGVLAAIGQTSMHWEFEVWGDEFRGRPGKCAASGSYITGYVGTANDYTSDNSHCSVPSPDMCVAALTKPGT